MADLHVFMDYDDTFTCGSYTLRVNASDRPDLSSAPMFDLSGPDCHDDWSGIAMMRLRIYRLEKQAGKPGRRQEGLDEKISLLRAALAYYRSGHRPLV